MSFARTDIEKKAVISFLSLLVVYTLFDIYEDLLEKVPLTHIYHEVLIILLCFSAILYFILKITKKNTEISSINIELDKSKKTLQKKSGFFLRIIEEQFLIWKLSRAEQEIAMFILKGFSMKEIAKFRESKERTVRQQSLSIYKKANVSGRIELVSYFLEDLF